MVFFLDTFLAAGYSVVYLAQDSGLGTGPLLVCCLCDRIRALGCTSVISVVHLAQDSGLRTRADGRPHCNTPRSSGLDSLTYSRTHTHLLVQRPTCTRPARASLQTTNCARDDACKPTHGPIDKAPLCWDYNAVDGGGDGSLPLEEAPPPAGGVFPRAPGCASLYMCS